MTIQTLKDVTLPNGITVKAGAVLNVPDAIGAALVGKGEARLRVPPGPAERKGERLNPGDPLPPAVPYVRVPAPPQPAASYEPGGYEDQDNFVRDLVTIPLVPWGFPYDLGDPDYVPPPPVTPSDSASGRDPLLTLDEIKIHCHIETDQTEEDTLLTQYEMAARLHTENYLRYQVDSTVGENIKQACLMLIGHWYRNREAVTTGRSYVGTELPFGYKELLGPERDYPIY